ncbi:MAG: hypothetical protein AAFN81_26335, partial [Bacteroidota bacterium]
DGTSTLTLTEGSKGQPTQDIPISKFPTGWGVVTFTASPSNLSAAGDVTLKWDGPAGATYAIEYFDHKTQQVVNIPKPGNPPLANKGQYPSASAPALNIDQTTIFTLIVTSVFSGQTHLIRAQQTVLVGLHPTVVSFTGDVTGQGSDQKLQLSWKTEQADHVLASWTNHLLSPNAKSLPLSLPFDKAYSLTAVAYNDVKSKPSVLELMLTNVDQISYPKENPRFYGSIAISPDGRFALLGRVYLWVIEIKTLKIIKTIPWGWNVDMAFTADSKFVLLANSAYGNVQMLETTNWTSYGNALSVGDGSGGNPYPSRSSIAITPDGKFALVADDPQVSMIDIQKWEVVKKMYPIPFASGSKIAITPDGKRAFATAHINLGVIDLENWKNPEGLGLGFNISATDIATTPDGKYVLVTCTSDDPQLFPGYVYVLDIEKWTDSQIGMPAAHQPIGITVSPCGTTALVLANAPQLTFFTIDLQTLTLSPTRITAGGSGGACAFTPDGKLAFVVDDANFNALVIGYGLPGS